MVRQIKRLFVLFVAVFVQSAALYGQYWNGGTMPGGSTHSVESTNYVPASYSQATDSSGYLYENYHDQPGGWGAYAGYSFAFAKLHMKESFEAFVLDVSNGTQTLVPFDYDYELTPRVWLGLRNSNGLGFRTSYWNFDHSSNGFQFTSTGLQIPTATATSVIFPASISGFSPGDQLTVESGVNATTLDFEGTFETNLDRIQLEFGGGLRYAKTDQTSTAFVTPFNIVMAPSFLEWQRQFEGIGPLFTASGRLPLGNCGIYAVGGANASFLFGEKNIRRTVVNDSTPPPNQGLPILLFEDANEISGIYGVRIGLGHERPTQFGSVFLEGTYEGQLWTDLGAPTLTFAGFNLFSINAGLNF
jgi:hypothetical protein